VTRRMMQKTVFVPNCAGFSSSSLYGEKMKRLRCSTLRSRMAEIATQPCRLLSLFLYVSCSIRFHPEILRLL
jgi:hypothetical protein